MPKKWTWNYSWLFIQSIQIFQLNKIAFRYFEEDYYISWNIFSDLSYNNSNSCLISIIIMLINFMLLKEKESVLKNKFVKCIFLVSILKIDSTRIWLSHFFLSLFNSVFSLKWIHWIHSKSATNFYLNFCIVRIKHIR